MRLIASLILAAMATPALAEPRAEQLIIVDNREVCGPARLAYRKRADAVSTAQRIARRIERERGIAARIVVLEPGQPVGLFGGSDAAPAPLILNNPC